MKRLVKIVPGTIITDYDGQPLSKAWKGRSWKYKESVAVKIAIGKHTLRAEAEFDPPIWLSPNTKATSVKRGAKIYVVDKNLAQPYGDPINNPNKYTVYQGYLTTEFNFEADHEYIAQVIIDQDDDFLLYIWDSNQYPYRNNSNSITSKSKTEKFFVSPNTPMKDSNSYNK